MSLKTIVCCIIITSSLAAFENAEHVAIGNAVNLRFPDSQSSQTFTLSNSLEVTSGEIVALSGDHFVPHALVAYQAGHLAAIEEKRSLQGR